MADTYTPKGITDLPWSADTERYCDAAEVYGADGYGVVEIDGVLVHKPGGSIHDSDAHDRPVEEMKANARYIAHACNEYPRAIDALREVLNWLQCGVPADTQPRIANSVRAVLTAAREREEQP